MLHCRQGLVSVWTCRRNRCCCCSCSSNDCTGRLQRYAQCQAQVPHHRAEDHCARASVELGGGQRQPHGCGVKVGAATACTAMGLVENSKQKSVCQQRAAR
jgi:hypothetical protein